MTSLDFWRRPEVFSYMVQMEPFILRFRWGDAPLWFAAAATFAYPEQIGMVQNFSYAHGSHNTVIDTQRKIQFQAKKGSKAAPVVDQQCATLFELKF
mmetsp:Transcript_15971/g.25647  ORF Transcript_15971/g.25647 Transcript_15971/m.25647 type:complete len:97 (+) Transcript_15971:2-292(+)